MEENNLVAGVMDEHSKDFGTRSLACKRRGVVSQCGQQVCAASWLRDAANTQCDSAGGEQGHGPSSPCVSGGAEQRPELSCLGMGTCLEEEALERPKQVAQHSFNRLLPKINGRESELLPQEGHGSHLSFKTSC